MMFYVNIRDNYFDNGLEMVYLLGGTAAPKGDRFVTERKLTLMRLSAFVTINLSVD